MSNVGHNGHALVLQLLGQEVILVVDSNISSIGKAEGQVPERLLDKHGSHSANAQLQEQNFAVFVFQYVARNFFVLFFIFLSLQEIPISSHPGECIYFHLPDHAIAEYWNDISAAAPHTDFVIYNIPQLAGVALSPSLFRKMRENPNVIGVKNSSMPVQDIQIFKALGGEESIVFNGPDEQFVGGRLMGADGGIGGTYGAMPELFLKMDAYIRAGEAEKATPIQYAVNEIISALCSGHGSMYAVIKEVMKKREGLDIGGVRKPQAAVIPEDQPVIDHAAELIDKAMETFIR